MWTSTAQVYQTNNLFSLGRVLYIKCNLPKILKGVGERGGLRIQRRTDVCGTVQQWWGLVRAIVISIDNGEMKSEIPVAAADHDAGA